MDDDGIECLECGAALAAGAARCPDCGVELTACADSGCGRPFPAGGAFCPFCGTPSAAGAAPVGGPATIVETPYAFEPDGDFAEPVVLPTEPPEASAVADAPPDESADEPADAPVDLAELFKKMGAGLPPAAPAAPGPGSSAFLSGQSAGGFGGIDGGGLLSPPSPAPPNLVAANYVAPAMAASSLAVPAAHGMGRSFDASDIAPISVEYDAGQSHQKGRQSLLRVRVEMGGTLDEATAVCSVESHLLAAPVTARLRLRGGDVEDLPGLRLTPAMAGSEQVVVAVTLVGTDGVPLGRWSGAFILTIADEARQSISAGGDVIIMGGREAAIPDLPDWGDDENWRTLNLKSDRAFRRRLSDTRPASPWDGPALPAAEPAAGMASLAVRTTFGTRVTSVLLGPAAGLGRGGDATVTWWLKPVPFDAHQNGRLSRRHAVIEIRDGLAWLTDVSTNGTWLNGERVPKGEPQLLARGDVVSPGQVVPLKVRLWTGADGVAAVGLERGDGLAGRLDYLLCAAPCPVPLPGPGKGEQPLAWAAWAGDDADAVRLQLCDAARPGEWLTPASQSLTAVGKARVVWSEAVPGDQDDSLDVHF